MKEKQKWNEGIIKMENIRPCSPIFSLAIFWGGRGAGGERNFDLYNGENM